jgi:hypothetical protein
MKNRKGIGYFVCGDCTANRSNSATLKGTAVRLSQTTRFINTRRQRCIETWRDGARDWLFIGFDDNGMINKNRSRCFIQQCECTSENIGLKLNIVRDAKWTPKWELTMKGAWWRHLGGDFTNG